MKNLDARNSGAINRREALKGVALATTALAFGRTGWASARAVSIPQKRLNNGVKMPMLGFGTYGLRGDVCTQSVADALAVGYRLVDTARVYENEDAVGAGI